MVHYDMFSILIMYYFINFDSWNSCGIKQPLVLPRTQRYQSLYQNLKVQLFFNSILHSYLLTKKILKIVKCEMRNYKVTLCNSENINC